MRHFNSLGPALALAGGLGLCLASATVPLSAQEQDIAPPPGGEGFQREDLQGEGYEALTRGPMHEAFASPYVVNPEPGVVVEEPPPEPIDEIPPDRMPAGNNVVWIPGYWGWDPDADQFLWISGLWRDVPTDRRWVPGYWAEVPEGWQWVSGFWTSAETEQLAYLPEPPDSLEHGPNVAPPDGDYFWVPGCWIWQEVSYEWRPGYWAPAVADWVWIPDQHVWTPYGCVFVPGYWDYTFVDRGVIFAPVHFETAVYRQPTFRYEPRVVIDTAPLLMHLFVSPTYSHYFYGDYYGFEPTRPRFDFYPWVAYAERPVFYDPLLTYYQWSYGRRDVNLVRRLTVWNQYFIRNEIYRPRRTFAAQQEFLARVEREDIPIQPTALAFAAPLREFAETRSERIDFREVAEPARERFVERAAAFREFQQQRGRFEVATAAEGEAAAPARQDEPAQPGQTVRPPERTLELPEATAVAEAAAPAPEARPGQDAAPGRETGGEQPATRPEPPPVPRPGARPEGQTGEEPGRPDLTRPADESATEPGQPDQPRPEERPGVETPDVPGRPGEEPARPGEDQPRPDQPRPDEPESDRPEAPGRSDRLGLEPGQPDEAPGRPRDEDAGPDLPPTDRPGTERSAEDVDRPDRGLPPGLRDRPQPDRPDADRPRPDRGLPGTDRPGADRRADDRELRFPRFGIGRDRQPGDEAADIPGAGDRGTVLPGQTPRDQPGPERDRPRGRRGFDPFGGLPPGIDEGPAPGARDRLPGPDRRPGLDPRGRRPGDDALSPDARPRPDVPRPGQPRDDARPDRGRRARPDLPGGLRPGLPGADRPPAGPGETPRPGVPGAGGRPEVPQPSPEPRPASPQAGPGGPQPPTAEGPERRPDREERGGGNDRDGNG